MKFYRFKHSRIQRRVGFWYQAPDGGPALIEEPSVRSGIYLNTKRFGLVGVEWR